MKRSKRIMICALLVLMGMALVPLPAGAHAQSSRDGTFSSQAVPCPSCPKAVRLVSPRQNAKVQQNNPSIGCPFDPAYGYGFQIYFDWAASPDREEIAYYELLVQRAGSPLPMLHTTTSASEYLFTSCGSFVIDENLAGWTWSVRAVDPSGNAGRWKTRKFSFEPFRPAN